MNSQVERSLDEARPFERGGLVTAEGDFAGDSNSGSESSASEGSCADSGDSASASPSGYGPMPEQKSVVTA